MSTGTHTFLFMDLVGFTALTAERGDDNAADVAMRLFAHVRRLLPEHCGEEIKTIGDAMMVRCIDPRQGVELGLRISEQIADQPDLPPLRIAVHTGSAVCRDGDWYGSAVNVAARLCSAAGGGEVLVSDATREGAGRARHLDFGARQLHWLKNVPQPVAARSAVRRRYCPSRLSLRELAKVTVGKSPPRVSLRQSEVTS
ncbi:MAG: adenylate/guanylate cyclase domain-containing protein [Actinomycetota bacterium]|nr:adenylate/guanylate cyclase domain-containing protein [Actinomycetota bacterium]